MEWPKGQHGPDAPGALSLDQILAQVSADDQEDWEYEYSATETEVSGTPIVWYGIENTAQIAGIDVDKLPY